MRTIPDQASRTIQSTFNLCFAVAGLRTLCGWTSEPRRFGMTFLLLAGLLSGCGENAGVRISTVDSADELKSKIGSDNLLIIHALDREHFKRGHIPGAINVDYEKMTPAMLPPDKNRPILFYCAGGGCPVSRMAARKAVEWGYRNVSVYEPGIKGWQAAGMPTSTGD